MSAIGLIDDRHREMPRRQPLIAGLAGLAVVAIAVGAALPGTGPSSSPAAVTAASGQTGWQSVPLAAQIAISRAIGADQSRYRVHAGVARVPEQGLSVRFSTAGVTVATAGDSARLGLRGPDVAPVIGANRVTYHRAGVSEWYANGPLGLEQGFTLSRSAPRVLTLAGGGSLHARVLAGATGLVWLDARGRTVLRERGLSAVDARGHRLAVRFVQSSHRGLSIAVDTAHAAFPVTVDPLIQSAKLIASDGYAGEGTDASVSNNGISAGGLGSSVAIDGATIAVGAPGAAVSYGPNLSSTYPNGVSNSHQGAVYVFTEPSTGWADATETAKLYASDGTSAGAAVSSGNNVYGDSLGRTVAIVGDTIVTGAPRASAGGQDYAGKLYVFTAASTGWVTAFQTAELAASNATADDFLGSSLAFDGQTIVAGVPNRNSSNYPGAAYVFAKPASGGWINSAQPAAQLNDLASSASDDFGGSLAISGATIAVGAPFSTDGGVAYAGAVNTFTRTGANWSSGMTSARLTPTVPVLNETMGEAVSIDANTLVVGGPHYASGGGGGPAPGAAYVFTNSGAWGSATQARLTAPDAAANDSFGSFVNVAGSAISVSGFPGGVQTLYGFAEPSGGWASGSTASENALSGAAAQYSSGSLAIQNGTAVAGVPNANAGATQGAGAALVLTTSPATAPPTAPTTTTSSTPTPTTTTTGSTPTPTDSTPKGVPPTPNPTPSAPAPAGPPLTFTAAPVFTDTTTAADTIAGLFGLKPGSGETENLGQFTFVAYCSKPQGQCAAGTSFGQQLGTNTAAHIVGPAARKKPHAVIWGTGKISIRAGKHGTVVVKLNAVGRRLLSRAHVLRGQLAITLSTHTTGTHAFTLRYRAKPKRTKR